MPIRLIEGDLSILKEFHKSRTRHAEDLRSLPGRQTHGGRSQHDCPSSLHGFNDIAKHTEHLFRQRDRMPLLVDKPWLSREQLIDLMKLAAIFRG